MSINFNTYNRLSLIYFNIMSLYSNSQLSTSNIHMTCETRLKSDSFYSKMIPRLDIFPLEVDGLFLYI